MSTHLKERSTPIGVLFSFFRGVTRATGRIFLRHAQGNRSGLPPRSAPSLLASDNAIPTRFLELFSIIPLYGATFSQKRRAEIPLLKRLFPPTKARKTLSARAFPRLTRERMLSARARRIRRCHATRRLVAFARYAVGLTVAIHHALHLRHTPLDHGRLSCKKNTPQLFCLQKHNVTAQVQHTKRRHFPGPKPTPTPGSAWGAFHSPTKKKKKKNMAKKKGKSRKNS